MIFKNLPPPIKQTHNKLGRKLKESDIEDYGRKEFKKLGWMMDKFTSPQRRSVPDDLCTAPGFIFYIEFKAPLEKATESQCIDHGRRRQLGSVVFVVDCYGQLDMVIEVVRYIMKHHEVPELPNYLLY